MDEKRTLKLESPDDEGSFEREYPSSLSSDLENLPSEPGVYIMKNESQKILYIGKTKNIKRRVLSYFTGHKDLKTELLRRKIARIESIICASDYEALLLENNLIKQHKPKYNINLKDDKTYPLVRITNEDFPRVFKTRQMVQDGSQYFGPFPYGTELENTLSLIREMFPLRMCKGPLKLRKSPCLYYHLKECMGPCIGAVSKEDYRRQVRLAKNLLEGNSKGIEETLQRKMRRASEELRFEEAARYRDQIHSLQTLHQDQAVEQYLQTEESRDYLAMLYINEHLFFSILQVRQGKVLDAIKLHSRYQFSAEEGQKLCSPEAQLEGLSQLLCLYYLDTDKEVPDKLFLPQIQGLNLESQDHELRLLRQLIAEKRSAELQIIPQHSSLLSKEDKMLLLQAKKNVLQEQQLWMRYQGRSVMLEELAKVLQLSELPKHIEGFDISHMDGQDTVASLIYFEDARPARENYRNFKIHSTEGMPNDFRAMQEAVSRRYSRLINEGLKLPDLILIDGGQGQVNAAAHVLRELELSIPLIGLAKKEETIIFPKLSFDKECSDSYSQLKQPINLPFGNPALKLLQQLRDECHRVAHGHNRRRREKKLRGLSLENIPGIGSKKSAKLLKHYGSLENIRCASAAELAKTAGVSESVAETLQNYLSLRKD